MKNKIITLLCTLGTCLFINPCIAHAQVDGYLIKNTNNTIYKYTVNDLEKSFLGDKKLSNHFQDSCKKYGLYAFCDNNKVVSYDSVLLQFLNDTTHFNLQEFIDNTSNNLIVNDFQIVNDKQDISPSVNTTKQYNNIKTPVDLEQYLNHNVQYNQITTPIGIIKLHHKIVVNNDIDKNYSLLPYDFAIKTYWDDNIKIEDINKLTKDKAYDTIKILQNYQTNIYNIASSIFPHQKITGGFFKDSIDQKFCMWLNYTTNMSLGYYTVQLTNFHWDKDIDSYYFNYKGENLYQYHN